MKTLVVSVKSYEINRMRSLYTLLIFEVYKITHIIDAETGGTGD